MDKMTYTDELILNSEFLVHENGSKSWLKQFNYVKSW